MTNKEINSVVHIASEFKYSEDAIKLAKDCVNNLFYHIPRQVIDDDAREEISRFEKILENLLENCTTYKIGKYIEENSEEIFK